jgi:FAD:protein FMN transferase
MRLGRISISIEVRPMVDVRADSYSIFRARNVTKLRAAGLGSRAVSIGNDHVFHFAAMGSPCAIHVDARNDQAQRAAGEAIREVRRIEARYSRYLPGSLLSQINRQAAVGGAIELDDETSALIDYAGKCHELSDGLFDVTSGVLRKAWNFQSGAPPDLAGLTTLLRAVGFDKLHWSPPTLSFAVSGMEIDFGGMAKEYAADRACAILLAHGLENCLVDLGGDIAVSGPRRDGSPWSIAIRGDRPGVAFAKIELSRGGLASSGDYERFIEFEGRRYSHILNPRTGWPVAGLSAASVLADQCMAAGTYATVAMLRGDEGAAWLSACHISHAGIDRQGQRFATPPFELAADG